MSCDLMNSASITFSSAGERDAFDIFTSGVTCTDSEVVISISDPQAVEIYHFSKPLRAFVAGGSGDPSEAEMKQFGQKVIDALVPAAPLKHTSSLPPYQSGPYYPDPLSTEQIVVDQVSYERIRTLDIPYYWHSKNQETWTYLAYDPLNSQVVEIIHGWL